MRKKERAVERKRNKGFKLDSLIQFGKHQGRTLKWILNNDVDYYDSILVQVVKHPEVDRLREKLKDVCDHDPVQRGYSIVCSKCGEVLMK